MGIDIFEKKQFFWANQCFVFMVWNLDFKGIYDFL
jgi:hypothetical protein